MISVHLLGGLGNQLFQIFTLIGYSIENNCSFIIPKEKPDKSTKCGDPRPTYWNNLFKSLTCYLDINNVSKEFKIYNEKNYHYTKIPFFKNQNIKLYGYFQSHLYFEKYKEQIINLIKIKETQQVIREKYKQYFQKYGEIVSLHFRIGDYKTIQIEGLILNINYYKKAIVKILEKNINVKNVLCFGQKKDYNLLIENIEKLKIMFPELNFILCDFEIQDWEQLILMSCCDHNIIANSTYSWWGAYLNNSIQKSVCIPEVWVGPESKYNKKDMYPGDWLKIGIQ